MAVGLVLVTIVMQGLVEPLRHVRVFWPWTYFGGPYGVDGDPERWLILSGSPQWYCVYLVVLCALGVVVAALHDREEPVSTAAEGRRAGWWSQRSPSGTLTMTHRGPGDAGQPGAQPSAEK